MIASYGQRVRLRLDSGEVITTFNRRKLGLAVAGDQVEVERDEAESLITNIVTRTNVLSRPDHRGQPRPFAANLSLMVVVVADQPSNDERLLDQYHGAAYNLGVDIALFMNKSDQWSAKDHQRFDRWTTLYQGLGTHICSGHTQSPDGLEGLIEHLNGQTAILVGLSGVGKSSVTRALIGSETIEVARLTQQGFGAHTTSTSQLYTSEDGGFHLIDSPGVRDFKLGHLRKEDIAASFVEIGDCAERCRYRNCQHIHEPDCAVKVALDEGKIAATRFASYMAMCRSE